MAQSTNLNHMSSKNVVSVSPDQSLQEAAALMEQHNLGALPVVDNGQIMGILTDRDITLRSTAQNKDGNTPCSECMTSDLVTGSSDMGIHDATNLMGNHQIRRLPVVEGDQLVGMVALGDFAAEDIYADEAGQALTEISFKPENN